MNGAEDEVGEPKLYDDHAHPSVKTMILDSIIDGTGPETTGKFGTGFLTTHLLSRIVEIEGIYINAFDNTKYQSFKLVLDRTCRKKEDMINKYREIMKTLDTFDDLRICPEVPNYKPGLACDTSFKYILDDKGRKTADRGLTNFYQCAGEVLAFNSKFESIVVNDKRNGKENKYIFFIETKIELVKGIDIIKIYNGFKGVYDNLIVARENHNL